MTIFVEQDEITLRGIRQYYINCEKEQWKFDVLTDLYDTLNIAQTVIFANTKKYASIGEDASTNQFY